MILKLRSKGETWQYQEAGFQTQEEINVEHMTLKQLLKQINVQTVVDL